jgi:hypothetical protein
MGDARVSGVVITTRIRLGRERGFWSPTVAVVEAMFASFVRSCCGQTCLGLRSWATSCLGSLLDLVLAVPEEHRLRLLFILNFGLV